MFNFPPPSDGWIERTDADENWPLGEEPEPPTEEETAE